MLKQMMDSMDHDARKLVRVNSKIVREIAQPGRETVVAAIAALSPPSRRSPDAAAPRPVPAAEPPPPTPTMPAHMLGVRFAQMSEVTQPDAGAERARGGRADGADGAGGGAREVASVVLEGEPAYVDPHLLNPAEGSGAAAAAGGRRRPDGGSGDLLLPQARPTPLRHSPRSRRAAAHAAAAAGAAAEYDADSSPEPVPEPAAPVASAARGRLV